MPAANYDILVEQGATFRFTIIYGRKTGTFDGGGNEIIDPYDLTGADARMQIRQRRGGEVLISATTRNGGITFDLLTSKVTISIAGHATNLLSMTRAKYDLEVQYPSGDVVRVLQGKVTISPNITQDANIADISPSIGTVFDVNEEDITGPD